MSVIQAILKLLWCIEWSLPGLLSHLTQVYLTLFYISCFPSQVHEPSRQVGEPERGPKPSSLEAPFVPPCKVKHKDALSAVKRVKSERCKRLIYKTACLSEAKQLYNIDIKRTCPVPREKGSPAKWIDVAKTPYGNPIRIAYVVTVHGRAFRQVKRLFKALYHSHHYFFFHIDTVSRYRCSQPLLAIGIYIFIPIMVARPIWTQLRPIGCILDGSHFSGKHEADMEPKTCDR